MTIHTWHPGMPERPCGTCSLCCKLPAIPPSPQIPQGKPAGNWCDHCRPGAGGCKIYDERPEGCRSFMCLWKIMPDFPETLRPDKCRVIWTMSSDGTSAIATTEYSEALETLSQRRLASQFLRSGVAVRAQISQIRSRRAR